MIDKLLGEEDLKRIIFELGFEDNPNPVRGSYLKVAQQLLDTMRDNERMREVLMMVYNSDVYSSTAIRQAVAGAVKPNKQSEVWPIGFSSSGQSYFDGKLQHAITIENKEHFVQLDKQRSKT